MTSSALTGIDCSRHQRWLDRALGSGFTLFVLADDGQVIWPATFLPPEPLLSTIGQPGTDSGSLLRRLDQSEQACILYRALTRSDQQFMGWGGLQMPTTMAALDPNTSDNIAEALMDVLDALQEERQQHIELESVTEELGARYEELHLVYSVDQHIQDSAGDYEHLFRNLLESAACHLMVDVVALIMPDNTLKLHAQSLSAPIHNLDLVLVEMRGDLFRFVQASGQTLVLNDLADPRRAYIFTDMPYKILACPIRTGDKLDAMIVLLNHAHKPDFTNSDRKLAEVLATQLASLSNSYTLVRRLSEFNEQIARSLIEAVEAKDPYTRGHSDRVSLIALKIGHAMDLCAAEIDELRWASLLHDVGKIGIPDAILCKPAGLTHDEYTFIKVHPERSYDILKHMKQLEMAAIAARHHQEQYDGKGYPQGLRGERIPLLSRIIAVADTYDSITSSRAYRAGRTHETAMAEITRISGTQLDPGIVRVFSQLFVQEPDWLGTLNIRRDGALT